MQDAILVDDASQDETTAKAEELGIPTFKHAANLGYGGNQKTCYQIALKRGADAVIMLHPDYQYDPRLIPVLTACLSSGLYDVALGSRILGGKAQEKGMPPWKYAGNRALTGAMNLLTGAKLSEYHTGYRAYTREVLQALPLDSYSDGFAFDSQLLCGVIKRGFRIAEVTCPTRYEPDSSSINFHNSLRYAYDSLAAAWNIHK